MKYPKNCCQKCGENIGYLGRFLEYIGFIIHQCKPPSKYSIVDDLDRTYFMSRSFPRSNNLYQNPYRFRDQCQAKPKPKHIKESDDYITKSFILNSVVDNLTSGNDYTSDNNSSSDYNSNSGDFGGGESGGGGAGGDW